MRATPWQIEDPEPTTALFGAPLQSMVSLHFVRTTLLRRWRALTAATAAGLLVGVFATLAIPAQNLGTVTLYLAHDTGSDPTTAMATDVTLLRTRAVAQQTIDALGLEITPEDLQGEITVDPATSSIMILTIPGPSEEVAVARAAALADTYLAFRSDQLKARADAVINGQQVRVEHLQGQIQELTDRYDALVARGGGSQNEATALLTQRAGVASQVSSLQQSIEQTSLDVAAVVTASRVLDPPAAEPHSAFRRLVLAAGSGLVGGAALGLALVLVTALTSLGLRRREEVAIALGIPVLFSAGQQRSLLPRRRARIRRHLDAVVAGLDQALLRESGERQGIALVAASESVDLAPLCRGLADRLALRGLAVSVVDLTPTGVRGLRDWPTPDAEGAPLLHRLEGGAHHGAAAIRLAGRDTRPVSESRGEPWAESDVLLVVDQIDLGVGVTHLAKWADRAVMVVKAGGSTAEALRTAASAFRRGGPTLEFAVLVGADRADDSSGLPAAAPAQPLRMRRES